MLSPGPQKLTVDNLKIVRAEFSTLRLLSFAMLRISTMACAAIIGQVAWNKLILLLKIIWQNT